jgi:hypothetical protein
MQGFRFRLKMKAKRVLHGDDLLLENCNCIGTNGQVPEGSWVVEVEAANFRFAIKWVPSKEEVTRPLLASTAAAITIKVSPMSQAATEASIQYIAWTQISQVAEVYAVVKAGDCYGILMELYPNGSLHDWAVTSTPHETAKWAVCIVRDVLQAAFSIHRKARYCRCSVCTVI